MKNIIPKSYNETLKLLNEGEYTILSGGTDLMIQHRNWSETLPIFNKDTISVFNLDELKFITVEENFLHIGATTSLEDIKDNELTPKILVDTINIMASPAIRNMATLAGNIGNASPAGDSLPVLYILNALIVLESVNGSREVPIDELILGPRRTTIQENEMIKEIKIPLNGFTTYTFEKIGGRKADAISKISFAGVAQIKNNLVQDFRVAFGAVGPTVVRKKKIEANIIGLTLSEVKDDIVNIMKEYEEFIRPIDDQRSNKEYRKQVALNLLEKFILDL